MTESYTVQGRLNFSTNAPAVIAELMRGFGQVNAELKLAQSNVGRLVAELRTLGGASRGINATVAALEKMGSTRLNTGIVADLDKMVVATRELALGQRELATSATRTAAAMREAAAASARGAGRGVTNTQVAAAAGTTRRQARAARGGGGADVLMLGVGAQMAGDAAGGFFERSFMAEAEVLHQLASLRLNTAVSDSDIAKARQVAEAATRSTPGSTLAANLHHLTDLFTVFGDLNEAMAGLPAFAQAQYVFKNMPGAHQGDSGYAAAQALEVMQRLMDPKTHKLNVEEFNRQMAAMQQVALGTGGRVDGSAYLAFAKQSRVGGMVANDDYLYRDLPAVLLALGGNRAGTGDAAVWSQFIAGRMTKNAFTALQGSGLIDNTAKWRGGQVSNMMGHLAGAQEFGQNRVQWVRDYILGPNGILAKKGIDPHNKLAVSNFFSQWASRQTGLGFLSELALGMEGINKEGAKIKGTTTDPVGTMRRSDPRQQIREFRAAENELMLTIGKGLMGPGLEALKGLTSVLRDLSAWGERNPTLVKDLAVVGGGLAIFAKGAGEAAIVLAIGGPFLKGIGGLAGALSPFGPGGAAAGALAEAPGGLLRLSGGLLGLAAAIPLTAWALKNGLGLAASIFGYNEAGAGHGGKGLRPPGDGPIPTRPPADEWGGMGSWLNRQYQQFRDAPAPGRGGGKGLQQRGDAGSATGAAGMVQVSTVLNVDGRQLAQLVSLHQARDIAGPLRGTTSYDFRASPFGGATVPV